MNPEQSSTHPVTPPDVISRANLVTLGLCAAATASIVALFFDAFREAAHQWNTSDTYAHGWIIAPIALWMIWRQRDALSRTPITTTWWPLPVLLGCAALWLVGSLAGVNAAMQAPVFAAIPLIIMAIVGNPIARQLSFPCAFFLLAVPVGDFMMPILMEHTASFTVRSLQLSGIPVFREGLNFALPSGNWSVVEACSGLRYLIASVTLGVLYAYLSYRSLTRRLVFIVVSFVVPIVANWVRAYLIVLLGHVSNMTLAVGVDHLIYGWVFFGLVMLLLFWIGGRWREDDQPDVSPEQLHQVANLAQASPARQTLVAALATACMASAVPVQHALLDRLPAQVVELDAKTLGVWSRQPDPIDLQPSYKSPVKSQALTYTHGDQRIGVFAAQYVRQHQNGELITYSNAIVPPDLNPDWVTVRSGKAHVGSSAQGMAVDEFVMRHALTGQALLVWRWYRVGSDWANSEVRVKLLTAWNILNNQTDRSAVFVLMTPVTQPMDDARRRLSDLMTPWMSAWTDAEHALGQVSER